MAEELQKIAWDTTRALVEANDVPREPCLNDASGEVAGSEDGPELIISNDAGTTHYRFPSKTNLAYTGASNAGALLIGTDSSSWSNISGSTTQAAFNSVDSSLTTISTTVNNAIIEDGSNAWTANQSVGGFSFTDLIGVTSDTNFDIDIDNDNNATTQYFRITKDNSATELFRVQENGLVGINDSSPGYALDITPVSSLGTFQAILNDDQPTAFYVVEGSNIYLEIDTSNGAEKITYGNSTTNPDHEFNGDVRPQSTITGPNFKILDTFTAQRTNNTTFQLATIAIDTADSTVLLEARVTAIDTTGAEGAAYVLKGAFKNDGGVLTQIGSTDLLALENDATWVCDFDTSGTDARISCQSDSTLTVDWYAVVTKFTTFSE